MEQDFKLGERAEGDVSADRQEQFEVARALLDEQSLGGAIGAGVVAALAGALAWGALSHALGASYSLFGIGVGILVGWGVRVFGRGVVGTYSGIAAMLAVLGCLAGNFAVVLISAYTSGVPAGEIWSVMDADLILDTLNNSINILDLAAWAVAAFCASWLAKRGLDTEEALAMYAYRTHRSG